MPKIINLVTKLKCIGFKVPKTALFDPVGTILEKVSNFVIPVFYQKNVELQGVALDAVGEGRHGKVHQFLMQIHIFGKIDELYHDVLQAGGGVGGQTFQKSLIWSQN